MEVLTTPYMRDWEKIPVVYAGDNGEPTHLLITGERLWRNTVVTLGGQKADRIEILPDMVGIVATFRCIETPTVERDRTRTPGSRGPQPGGPPSAIVPPAPPAKVQQKPPYEVPYTVPVIVWTSEGHTLAQDAIVVVRGGQPCATMAPDGASWARAVEQPPQMPTAAPDHGTIPAPPPGGRSQGQPAGESR